MHRSSIWVYPLYIKSEISIKAFIKCLSTPRKGSYCDLKLIGTATGPYNALIRPFLLIVQDYYGYYLSKYRSSEYLTTTYQSDKLES